MQFLDYYTPCWLNFWFWGHSEYHRHSNMYYYTKI